MKVQFEALDQRRRTEWDSLGAAAAASPFQRPGWLVPWSNAFAPGRSLRLLTLRRGADLVAALPLLANRTGALRSPTNGHTPHYGVVSATPADAEALLEALFAIGPPHVDLGALWDVSGEVQRVVASAEATGYATRVLVQPSSPCIDVSSGWEEYAKSLSRSRRREIGRSRRRLEDHGRVDIDETDGTERLDDHLAEAYRVESTTWQGGDGLAMSSQRTTQQFYRDVARWAADAGALRIAFLRVDREPIAFAIDLQSHGARYGLKTGYDRAFGRFGPGMILHAELIERAFSQPDVHSYELLGACDPWKLVWATGERTQSRVQAYAKTPRGIGQHILSSALVEARTVARDRLPAPITKKALSLARSWSDRAEGRGT